MGRRYSAHWLTVRLAPLMVSANVLGEHEELQVSGPDPLTLSEGSGLPGADSPLSADGIQRGLIDTRGG